MQATLEYVRFVFIIGIRNDILSVAKCNITLSKPQLLTWVTNTSQSWHEDYMN